MKKVNYIIYTLGLIFALSSCQQKQHKAIYIDGVGSDKADGSLEHPYKEVNTANRNLLLPGDTLYLVTNNSRYETAIIDSISGSFEKPIVILPFRPSENKISSMNKEGLIISNSKYLEIRNLHFVGNGRKEGNTTDGLLIRSCSEMKISNIEMEGYQKSGLHVEKSKNIVVDSVFAHDNGATGILVSGDETRKDTSKNIVIRNCKAENNPGDPTNLTNHSGNGILAGNCTNVVIEYCTATNNGWDMPRVGNGPVGIWVYEADSVTIQYCISYKNRTQKGAADGGGFDLDGGVTNSVIQYCLSYENEGSGYGLFQYAGATDWYNNTVRYCISENDGAGSTAHGSVFIWNAMNDSTQLKDCYFYNNTIYNEKGAAISYETSSAHHNFYFYNNIFISQDDLIIGDDKPSVFLGNCWYSLSLKGFKTGKFNDINKWSLQCGKEILNKQMVGLTLLPDFISPSKTTLTDPHQLHSYFAYQINNKEILHEKGLDLSQFGIQIGEIDINGNKVTPKGIGAYR